MRANGGEHTTALARDSLAGSAACSRCSRAVRRSFSSAARAPRPATRRTSTATGALRSRGRSSPCTCRSSRPAQVFALDGFGAALNSERLWDPQTGLVHAGAVRAEPLLRAATSSFADGRTLLVGGHIDANEGLADTTLFNADDRHVLPRRRHGGRPLVSDGDAAAGRQGAASSAGDESSRNRPGAVHAFEDSSVNSLPSIYNPTTNTWTDLTSGAADVAALPVHCSSSRTAGSSTPARIRSRAS